MSSAAAAQSRNLLIMPPPLSSFEARLCCFHFSFTAAAVRPWSNVRKCYYSFILISHRSQQEEEEEDTDDWLRSVMEETGWRFEQVE